MKNYRRSDSTPRKTEHHRAILASLVGAAAVVINREAWPARCYRYFDLTAGPGLWQGEPQSPLCAVDALCRAAAFSPAPLTAFRADFYEREAETFGVLASALATHDAPAGCQVLCHEADGLVALREVASSLPPRTFGAVYYDPSPKPLTEMFNGLERLAEIIRTGPCSRLDVILSLSATTIKRVHKIKVDGYRPLPEILAAFDKKTWLLRDPFGHRFQWTLAVGTNYLDAREQKRLKLVRADTDAGELLLDRLARTRADRCFGRQQTLFGDLP